MCGRYSLSQEKEPVNRRFGIVTGWNFHPRYNVCAGQVMPVITDEKPLQISLFRWGLIPEYSPDVKTADHYINVRSETLLNRSPFRQTLRNQRCLIIADGYYDWKKEGKSLVPYRFTLMNDEIFAMAGIWDRWENPKGEILYSFSVITKAARGITMEISDRMPVILSEPTEKKWLENRLNDNDILSLIEHCAQKNIVYYKCHKVVNSMEVDVPQCLEHAPKLYPGETYNLFGN
jgi:putative SOS response-associated peptidase YedK